MGGSIKHKSKLFKAFFLNALFMAKCLVGVPIKQGGVKAILTMSKSKQIFSPDTLPKFANSKRWSFHCPLYSYPHFSIRKKYYNFI